MINFDLNPTKRGRFCIEMYCYCQTEMQTDFMNLFDLTFEDNKMHCNEWWEEYKFVAIMMLVPSFFVQFMNLISMPLFIWLAQLEGQPTQSKENESIFILIFAQQFVNISIIQIFSEANFQGFDTPWFMTVGSSLCFAMIMNIVSSKASETSILILNVFLRCIDRSCSWKMTKGKVKVIDQ